MAKTKAEVEGRQFILSDDENPLMRLRVRRKGDGKISTGQHDQTGGDLLYEEGEEFVVRKDVADALIDLDYADEVRGDTTEALVAPVVGEPPPLPKKPRGRQPKVAAE